MLTSAAFHPSFKLYFCQKQISWNSYFTLFPFTSYGHHTSSKDFLFFLRFSEFIYLDSDAPAGLKKKCNTNKLL